MGKGWVRNKKRKGESKGEMLWKTTGEMNESAEKKTVRRDWK